MPSVSTWGVHSKVPCESCLKSSFQNGTRYMWTLIRGILWKFTKLDMDGCQSKWVGAVSMTFPHYRVGYLITHTFVIFAKIINIIVTSSGQMVIVFIIQFITTAQWSCPWSSCHGSWTHFQLQCPYTWFIICGAAIFSIIFVIVVTQSTGVHSACQ